MRRAINNSGQEFSHGAPLAQEAARVVIDMRPRFLISHLVVTGGGEIQAGTAQADAERTEPHPLDLIDFSNFGRIGLSGSEQPVQ